MSKFYSVTENIVEVGQLPHCMELPFSGEKIHTSAWCTNWLCRIGKFFA